MLIYIVSILILGAFVGLVSGMFGLGGGGIIVPALVSLFPLIGVPPSQIMFMAMGTAFATMIISTSASAYNQYKYHNILFNRIWLFLPILLLAVILTSQIVTSLNPNFLKIAFSLFLIYLALKMLLKRTTQTTEIKKTPSNWKDVFSAFAIGVISTLGSISGAGLIVTYLKSTGMNVKKAIGTASFCGVFLTIFASIGFIISGLKQPELPAYSLGYIHLPTMLILAIVSIPMTKKGVALMSKLPDKKVTRYFAYFLLTLSAYVLINSLLAIL